MQAGGGGGGGGVVTIIIKIEISTLPAEVVLPLLATVMSIGEREREGEGSELCCENDISSQDSRTVDWLDTTRVSLYTQPSQSVV